MAKIQKTATERKQERLMKKHFSKKKTTSSGRVRRKKKGLSADHLIGRPYIDFLNSHYWKIVRDRVLKRDGNKCRICSATKRLEVHHDTYKNHFKEHLHLEDLLTLCKDCHKEHHNAQM